MIYITSDLHFCHNKEFIYKPRGFDSVYKHNEQIVKNWNKTITKEDTVYILGDLMLNDNVEGRKLFNQLNRQEIKLIIGNHDTDNRIEMYKKDLWNAEVLGYATMIKYNKWTFYLSHYPVVLENRLKDNFVCLCGHSHTNNPFEHIDIGCYHVELDAHNNTPISLDFIIEELERYKRNH